LATCRGLNVTLGLQNKPTRAEKYPDIKALLAILALALLLTGCEGDRIKNGSMNGRQAQPQSTVLT
jgi:hypothetical protein